jgi:hypothetical protein
MNKKSQFLDLVKSSIEDEALRTKLVDAGQNVFTEFELAKDDAIESRDKAKAKSKLLTEKLGEIQKSLSLEDDFTVGDITEKIKKAENSDDIEAKYKGDIEALRRALSDKDNSILELQTKFDDTMFTNAISQSGVMDNYVSDTMARDNIINMYKENTIFEDGKIYAKDTATGKVATDLETGVKLGLDSVATYINSKLNPMYLTAEIKATGGGTPPNQTTPTGKKFSDYTSAELVALNRTNPTAYQALKNAQ